MNKDMDYSKANLFNVTNTNQMEPFHISSLHMTWNTSGGEVMWICYLPLKKKKAHLHLPEILRQLHHEFSLQSGASALKWI